MTQINNAFMGEIVSSVISEVATPVKWPEQLQNADTRKFYEAHHQEEHDWVYEDHPRYCLIKGGEGSGKSVALVIKTLNRLRRGMDGIMVSPNLPHFRRSLFPEFLRWLPRQVVIKEHQKIFHKAWRPYTSFDIVVRNEVGGYSRLTCAGGENPLMLEGPNLNFAALDEIRGMPDDNILKVLSGRIRIPGPNGEPPQLFCSSTPRMHWMFEYFGPPKDNPEDDLYLSFKEKSRVVTLRTEDNVRAGNLDADYIEARGAPLTEQEKNVRLAGEWEDEVNEGAFLDTIVMWDRLKEDLPTLTKEEGLVLGVDGAVTRDHFAIVGVTRHPKNKDNVAVRVCKVWKPRSGQKIDFQGTPENPGPELYIRELAKKYNIVTIVYDIHQLHDMMSRLFKDGVAWCQEFGQTKSRSIADQFLYDQILKGTITHNGNKDLHNHLRNADAKMDHELHKRRLTKRAKMLKIDAAVALSMATYECLRLNLR